MYCDPASLKELALFRKFSYFIVHNVKGKKVKRSRSCLKAAAVIVKTEELKTGDTSLQNQQLPRKEEIIDILKTTNLFLSWEFHPSDFSWLMKCLVIKQRPLEINNS